MTWMHKDVEIQLEGATFIATLSGKRMGASSLAAAKKAIDKHLDIKAQEVVLNLPVVVFSGTKSLATVVTGLNTTTLELIANPPIPWLFGGYTLPDDEESREVYAAMVAAEKALMAAQKALKARHISTHFYTSRRPFTTYGEAIVMLQKSYDDAKKGEAE